VVADTRKLEQLVGNLLDGHELVDAFVKNAGLGFAIPYLHNGQSREYQPDFIIRLRTANGAPQTLLILETKGFDPLEEVKREAALRWVAAVNAEGSYVRWAYEIVRKPEEVPPILSRLAPGP
jgi:type III restriction enzyme